MNTEQMALIAGIAQDIENISIRLQELVRGTLTEAEENADWRPLPDCVVDAWRSCPHKCTLCQNANRDKGDLCWVCDEELTTVPQNYPEEAAEAKQNSLYGDGAFHALILRIRANNNREAADDTSDQDERASCLREAEILDTRATQLLYNKANSHFKPWWMTRWEHSVSVSEATPEASPAPYKNRHWPSPRPKLFAKACAPHLKAMKHHVALEFLAERANITVDELLKMDPDTYITKYMDRNAPESWQRIRYGTYLY